MLDNVVSHIMTDWRRLITFVIEAGTLTNGLHTTWPCRMWMTNPYTCLRLPKPLRRFKKTILPYGKIAPSLALLLSLG